MALFGTVCRVMTVQHTLIILFFSVIVVTTEALVFFLLSGHLVRLVVCRRVIQCGLQTFVWLVQSSEPAFAVVT